MIEVLFALFTLVGFLIVVLLIVFIAKVNVLKTKIDRLEGRLNSGQTADIPLQSPIPEPPTVSFQKKEPISPSPATEVPKTPPPILREPPKRVRSRAEWEALVGGKIMNRIGALALIIGIGFFLKYAFDNNWITETMRVTIGFVSGIGLLAGAIYAHKKKYSVFAQGLIGAGESVLYLSVFASFNFYHLVPQVVAFVMMSAVTIIAFLLAIKYDSLAIAALGWAGGFLTPFMLSTGQANEVGLFTYIGLLDAGILAVILLKKKWWVLNPLAMGATYFVYYLWQFEYYTDTIFVTAVFFLTLLWGLFFAEDLIALLKTPVEKNPLREIIQVGNGALFVSMMYRIVNPLYHDAMGFVIAGIGAVYLASAFRLMKQRGINDFGFARFLGSSIFLLWLATTIHFEDFTTVVWWSVEALLLVWIGVRFKLNFVRLFGFFLFLIAAGKLLGLDSSLVYRPIDEFSPLLNRRAFTFMLLAVCSAAGSYFVHPIEAKREKQLSSILQYLSWGLFLLVATIETIDYYRLQIFAVSDARSLEFMTIMAVCMCWALFAAIAGWCGSRFSISSLMITAAIVWAGSALFVVVTGFDYDPIEQFTLLLNSRALAMLIVAGSGYFVTSILSRSTTPSLSSPAISVLRLTIFVLIFFFLTAETVDVFSKEKATLLSHGSDRIELARVEDLKQLAVSGVWLAYSVILMVIGLWKKLAPIRIMAIVLFGLTILKVFLYDLSFLETLYRIFSFVGLGIILLIISFLYQRYRSVILGNTSPKIGTPQE